MDDSDRNSGVGSGRDPETEALEELVGEALEALESGGPKAVDALLRGHPERADAVRRRLVRLEQLGLLESAESSDLPERVGEFAIEDVLAEGGMGVVYRARDESLGRTVALKIVRPELLLVPGARARIRREAEAAAQLNHPNIAVLHRYGEQDGLPFLAMELVEGRSLAQVLDAAGGPQVTEPKGQQLIPGGPASWTAACLQVCAEVARALAHAHERGVLHRDVKPSNVLVDEQGHARLVDFGLARMEGGGQLTRTGSQVGSLYYMAPEQLLERSANLDGRVDVYALGVMLYELLTRTSPFAGHPPEETIRRIREGHFERPRRIAPHLSRDVEAVLLQAMSLDRERRYLDAGAFAEELDNLLALRPVVARRPTAAARVRSWMRRRPRLATAMVLTLVAAFAGWGLVVWLEGSNRRALAAETTRTTAQTAALGELLTELGLMLDEAMLSQDGVRIERIQERLATVEANAVELPQTGNVDPLVVANGRLALAIASAADIDLKRAVEHINVAREALGVLGDDAPLQLTFRAHAVLCNLARQIDDAPLRLESWKVAQAFFAKLEAAGDASVEDRLLLMHGAVDEANLARANGDYGRAIDLLDQAQGLYDDVPDTRAERLSVGRIWVESGRLFLGQYEYDRARVAASRAADLLEGVEANTPPLRQTLAGLARLESDLLAVQGDIAGAAERLDRAAIHVSPSPETKLDFDIALRTLDQRLRLAKLGAESEAYEPLIRDLRAVAQAALKHYGMFEEIRGASLQVYTNLVGVCMSTERYPLGRDVGREGLEAWQAWATPGELPLVHAQLLNNLGALEQSDGDELLALKYLTAADEVFEIARKSGRDDDLIDRSQLPLLTNQGVIARRQGQREEAEELLTRARSLSGSIASRSGNPADWLRHARIGQELANVHMETERSAHSIGVLEESIAELDDLELRGALTAELAYERDGQCFSLMVVYIQTGGEEAAHALLRRVLEREAVDPELDGQFALAAAYAIRTGHPDVARDRELCEAWIERADSSQPGFKTGIDSAEMPWSLLVDGD